MIPLHAFYCSYSVLPKCSCAFSHTLQDASEQPPFPATLHFSNKMGRIVSAADFLVSHGLALKNRKPRSVHRSGTAFRWMNRHIQSWKKDFRQLNPVADFVSFKRESEGARPKQTCVHSSTSQAGCATKDEQLIQPHTSTKHPPKPTPRRFISAEMVMTFNDLDLMK